MSEKAGNSGLDRVDYNEFNPGPLFLCFNALGITLITYTVSFASLNISRALKAYDARVPIIRALPKSSLSSANKTSEPAKANSRLRRLILPLIVLSINALFVYTYYTADKSEFSRVVFEGLFKIFCVFIAYLGLSRLPGICGRPTEAFRIYTNGEELSANPEISSVGGYESNLIYHRALILLATYAGVWPNQWLTALASMGLAAGLIRSPMLPAPTLSVRSAVLITTAMLALLVTAISFAFISAFIRQTRSGTSEIPHSRESDWLEHNAWGMASYQTYGATLGFIAALILRYEYSLSETMELPIATMTSPPTLAGQSAQAIPREPVPTDHSSFPKPLFHVLIASTFLVHVPAIVLSLPSATWIRASPEVPDWVRVVAQMTVILPGQLWMLIVSPVIIGVAYLVRVDGRAIWNYTEMRTRPVVSQPSTSLPQYPNKIPSPSPVTEGETTVGEA